MTLTFRVDRVYRGDFDGDEIEVTSDSHGCGDSSQAEHGVAAFLLYKRGDWHLSQCIDPLNPYTVEALIDGLPAPAGKDPPEFVVGHDLGPAVVSLLDSQGKIIRSGERLDPTDHDSQVGALATCHDDDSVGVVLSNSRSHRVNRDEYQFEIRSLSDLQVESSATIGFDRVRGVWPLTRLSSVECHGGERGLMTLLVTRPRTSGPRLELAAPAHLVIFEDGQLTGFEIPVARSMTVDPTTRLAYLLNEDGTRIVSWDIDARAQVDEFTMPPGTVGWYLRMMGDELQVLGRGAPPAGEPDFYPRINRLLSGPPGDLVMQVLDAEGGLVDVTPNGDGLIALLRNPNRLAYIESDGSTVVHPLTQEASAQIAIGSQITLVAHTWGYPNEVGVLGPERIPARQLQHLGAAGFVLAISPGDEPIIAPPASQVAQVQPGPSTTGSGRDRGVALWVGAAVVGSLLTGLWFRSRRPKTAMQ